MERVLEIEAGVVEPVADVTPRERNLARRAEAIIDRVEDVEAALVRSANGSLAEVIHPLVHRAGQDVVPQAERVDASGQVEAGHMRVEVAALGRVGPSGQHAPLGIVRDRADLIVVVAEMAEAVAEMQPPIVVEAMLDVEAGEMARGVDAAEAFVEAAVARDLQGTAGARIEDGAAVEWNIIMRELVGHRHLGVVALPGE